MRDRERRQNRMALLLLPLLAAAWACAAPEPVPAPAAPPAAGAAAPPDRAGDDLLAITGVTVIPMDRERVLRDHTVLVSGGRITMVAPTAAVTIPAGARIVDGTGRWLIPGLAEMHAHIPPPQAGPEVLERTLFLYVANGVTTVRGMLGHPAHLELRERAARNEILAPRVYTSGPSFNGNSAPTPEVAVRMVEEQHAAGYDFLKLHPGLSREVFDALVAAARRVGIPFAGHVPAGVGLDRALEAGQASIDHLDGYVEALAGRGGGWDAQASGFFGFNLTDEVQLERLPGLVERTRAAGVWNAPTQTLLEHLFGPATPEEMAAWPEMRYVPTATLEAWVRQTSTMRSQPGYTPARAARFIDVRRRLMRELDAAGAGIILASDAPQIWNVPGYALHREMRMMAEAGIPVWRILASGSRNAAAYLGSTGWGTIAPGQAADLILLEGNPLDDIASTSRIAGVALRGRWLSRAELDAGLERIARDLQQ